MHVTQALSGFLAAATLASASGLEYIKVNPERVRRQAPGAMTPAEMANMNNGMAPAEMANMNSGMNSNAASMMGEKVVQIVTVSDNNGTLRYFPEQVVAPVGSVVQFQFYPKNHTVTESTFANPCVPAPANISTETRPGQKSGFVPIGATADIQFRPVWNMLINDTKPIWIFCGQKGHCAKGMAMVVNQDPTTTEKTLENYKKAAALLAPPAASSATSATDAATVATSIVAATAATAATTATDVAITPGATATTTATGGPALGASTTTASPVGTFTGAAVPGAVALSREGSAGIAGLVLAAIMGML